MTRPNEDVNTYEVRYSSAIDAPPERVYRIFADYHHHAKVLPPQFRNLVVEKGGVGAGTVIRFDIRALGQTRIAHGVVSEPEPGRVLVESYDDGTETSFIVEPAAGGTHLTFATKMRGRAGLAGKIEQFFASRFLRSVYADEMKRAADYARTIA